MCGRTVTRVGSDRVVKSGDIRPHEAPTLRFIATKTTIPVPKVHDVHWEYGKVVAIVMDYMPDKRLDEAWNILDSDQKHSIASELHSYMNQLRDLKGDFIGAIDRGKAITGQIASIEGGPFDSEKQFNEFILGDIVKSAPDLLRHYAKFALINEFSSMLNFHRAISSSEGGRVTAILDWEYAGWYPEH